MKIIIDELAKIPDPTIEKIRALMARKGWTQTATAKYLGVPLGTLGNWMQGTKHPSKVVGRLVEVLLLVETFAPHVYTALLPAPVKDKE